jgi:serine/threonine protein kinase/tetratricopeptide (TPR) repeat protein
MPGDPLRVQAIFLTVVDKPAAERSSLLDRECGGDAEVRQQVEALLEAHEQLANTLDRPAAAAGATRDWSAQGDREPLESVGTSIGPYKLQQKLGEGGMGTVWVAEQQQPVRRRVALKVIKPGMDSAQVIHRFETERQALAMMDHVNIARVFDAGSTPQGRPYFVMELVQGVPITRYCDELQLPIRERLALFIAVCRAVQHAHQNGIIHRDLKPSNVLVCLQDGRPVPKVIDFGVAKALHGPLADSTIFTEFGAVIGTVEYMSPEQAEMSPLGVDTRTDIYALGVLLYELLTGSTPLDRTRLRKAAYAEMLRIIKEEEPPRPSTRLTQSKETLASLAAKRRTEPARLTKEVRGDLDWIVMKCLEKDRIRRYEGAGGLARDIERYLQDEPVEACPPSAGYRLRKYARRHRATLVTAGALVLLLVLGVIASTWQALRATWAEAAALSERDAKEAARQDAVDKERRARDAAEAERIAKEKAMAAAAAEKKARDAEAEQRLRAEQAEKLANARLAEATLEKQCAADLGRIARAVNEFLQADMLGQADSTQQANRGFKPEPNLTVKEALKRAAARIGARFKDDPLVEAAIRHVIGDTYLGLGEARLGIPHLEQAAALLAAKLGPDHRTTLVTLSALAAAYDAAGQRDKALPLFEKIPARFKDTLGPDALETLSAMNNLAHSYLRRGQGDRALSLLEEALAKHKEKVCPDHPDTIRCMSNLAEVHIAGGRYDRAIPLCKQALAAAQRTLGPDHPDTLQIMNNLASAYNDTKHPDWAIPLFEQVLAKQTEYLGADHTATLAVMNNLAAAYQQVGKLDRALPLLEKVLGRFQEKLGPDHPSTLTLLNNVAGTYKALKRLDKALPLFTRVLTIRKQKLGLDHPDTLTSMNNLAATFLDAQQPKEAVPLFEQALARFKQILGAEHPHTVTVMASLAVSHLRAGEVDKAMTSFRSFLEVKKKQLAGDNLALASLEMVVAQEFVKAHLPAAAEPFVRRSLAIREKHLKPGDWTNLNTRSMLGGVLLDQKKYAEAEPLLRDVYKDMKERAAQIPAAELGRITEVVQRLVRLYEATGNQEQAAKWRMQLKKD